MKKATLLLLILLLPLLCNGQLKCPSNQWPLPSMVTNDLFGNRFENACVDSNGQIQFQRLGGLGSSGSPMGNIVANSVDIRGGGLLSFASATSGNTWVGNGSTFTPTVLSFLPSGGSSATLGIDTVPVWGAVACSGTMPASSTVFFMGGSTCATLPTTTIQYPGGQDTVTLGDLHCKAQTGGVNSSSGAVTVLKNGSATSITCTFGTGTTCDDSRLIGHSSSIAGGDLVSYRITTQAAETLASVACTIRGW